MKNLPLYENLDTSFVNLSALVRYLRSRRFTGSVRVELDGYEAEIALEAGGEPRAREHDLGSGRIAEGEEAFQRLLIRAREPGGAIHVFETVEEARSAEPKIQVAPPVKREILEKAAPGVRQEQNVEVNSGEPGAIETSAPNAFPLPLEFSNRVEEKARQALVVTEQDWQMLLQLAGELLGAVDQTLRAAGLDFVSAFAAARAELAADYPFLHPSSGAFEYKDGQVEMSEPVSPKVFAASLNESLRRFLERLGAEPGLAEVYRRTVQALLALIHRRKPLYDKFSITPQLEKILGV